MVTQPGDCALDLNGSKSKYNSTSNCAWYENAASSNLLSGVKTWSTAVSFSLTHWDVLFDDAMPSINSRLIMEHHTGTLDWMCEHWMEIFWIVAPADSKSCYFLKFLTTFAQLSARLTNFLRGWLLVLGLKEGLVECATVCVKSVVILTVWL